MQVMVAVEWGMLALGLFGLVTSSVFLGIVLVGADAVRREAVRQERILMSGPEFLPPVSLFKPLHGAETGLEGNLRTFFDQDYLQHATAAGLATRQWGFAGGGTALCADGG